MSTAPDRALRDRIRSEETFCVTLVDWQGALAARQVFEQFMKIFSDAGLSPSVWLASHGMDQGVISGWQEIENTLKERVASCFELTLRHERDDFPGAWDMSCLFYDANNEHEQTGGLSCLQVAVLASRVADKDAMSASLAKFVADRTAFCYGYAFTAAYGLDLETYGPGLATSGAICPELEDPYAWPKELLQAMPHHAARPHRKGMLRFVYPRNFLSESQLRMPVDEVDLQTWIRKERMGCLEKLANQLWAWDLDEEEIHSARIALGRRGKLLAFRVRPGPAASRRGAIPS